MNGAASSRRVLLIDNYDSFTYNLVQALAGIGAEVEVRRNDEIDVGTALAFEPTQLVISPGPGRPERAGASMAVMEALMPQIPVLGVCLGHQALAAVAGARVGAAQSLMHGKESPVYHDGRTLYEGLPNPFRAGRYHSLAVEEASLPSSLSISAYTSDGEIMGLRHATLPTEGVQFHPESVLTPEGERLLRNFLDLDPPVGAPWRELLRRLVAGQDLSEALAGDLLHGLLDAGTDPIVAGAVLAALHAKGETPGEVRGLALAMRELALRPALPEGLPAVDIVGTGGDGSGSFNISTGAALLAAAAGVPVVKHGNRSVSSRSGSADLLEALGYELPPDAAAAARSLAACGFTFLFAPTFHPAMKAVAAVRGALGVRTVFNILGPLTNPAAPPYGVIGAFDAKTAALMADTLSGLPLERAFVVHGEPGWDEATPVGPFLIFDVRRGSVEQSERDPAELGLARCEPEDLAGGDAEYNAAALVRAFDGEPGAHRDALVLGAALALEVAGVVATPVDGIERAAAALDDGSARRLLERLPTAGARES